MIKSTIFGGLAISLAFIALFPELVSPTYTEQEQVLDYKVNGLVRRNCINCSPGTGFKDTFNIDFTYSPKVTEGDSFTVTLKLDKVRSNENVFISLNSTNFDISPSSKQIVLFDLDEPGEKTTLKWTLQPKKMGNHFLVLDIRELLIYLIYDVSFTETILVGDNLMRPLNIRSIANSGDASIELPIEVVTIWGISNKLFLLLRGLIGLIAFVFATPILYGLFTKRKA